MSNRYNIAGKFLVAIRERPIRRFRPKQALSDRVFLDAPASTPRAFAW